MTDTTLELVAEIVSAFVSNNKIESCDIPGLIQSTYKTMATVGEIPVERTSVDVRVAKARIKKSIHPDGLISFIDGKTYKTLRRHLSKHGMSVADYKERFGLPLDYPMTSSEYSATRSELARRVGLGRKNSAESPADTATAAKHGRPAKTILADGAK